MLHNLAAANNPVLHMSHCCISSNTRILLSLSSITPEALGIHPFRLAALGLGDGDAVLGDTGDLVL